MKFFSVKCDGVTEDALKKLSCMIAMTKHNAGQLAGMILESGINESWEMYSKNPKYKDAIRLFDEKVSGPRIG